MSKHNNYSKYKDYSKLNYDPKDDRAVANAIVAKAEEDRKAREALMAQFDEEPEANVEVEVDECAACDPVEESAEELPTIDTNGNEPLVGVTTTKLNIRSNPFVAADNVVTVVNEGTVVMIDYPVADGEWFKVYTEAGIEGYCMKKFVKVSN